MRGNETHQSSSDVRSSSPGGSFRRTYGLREMAQRQEQEQIQQREDLIEGEKRLNEQFNRIYEERQRISSMNDVFKDTHEDFRRNEDFSNIRRYRQESHPNPATQEEYGENILSIYVMHESLRLDIESYERERKHYIEQCEDYNSHIDAYNKRAARKLPLFDNENLYRLDSFTPFGSDLFQFNGQNDLNED
jgi:hypothetical protein